MKVEATKMERLNKVPLHRAPRKIPLKLQDVSGHDFSRAKRATKSHWASAPSAFCFQLFGILQRLKPESGLAIYGTTKIVP